MPQQPNCSANTSSTSQPPHHDGLITLFSAWMIRDDGLFNQQRLKVTRTARHHHQHRSKLSFQFHCEPFKLAPLGMPAPHYHTCNKLEPLWQGVPNHFSPSCCRETSRCTSACSMAAPSPGPTLPSPPAPATLWTLSPPLQQAHTAPFPCKLQPLLPARGVRPCDPHEAKYSGLRDLQPRQLHGANPISTAQAPKPWSERQRHFTTPPAPPSPTKLPSVTR